MSRIGYNNISFWHFLHHPLHCHSALPFFNQTNGIPWLFGLYGNTMRYYNYATVNATNLYFLFGQNWVGISNAAPFLLRLSGSLVMLVPLIVLAVQKHKNQSESLKTNRLELFSFIAAMLPALAVLLPMSFQVMGTLLMVSVFLAVGSFYISGKQQTNLPLLASNFAVASPIPRLRAFCKISSARAPMDWSFRRL